MRNQMRIQLHLLTSLNYRKMKEKVLEAYVVLECVYGLGRLALTERQAGVGQKPSRSPLGQKPLDQMPSPLTLKKVKPSH